MYATLASNHEAIKTNRLVDPPMWHQTKADAIDAFLQGSGDVRYNSYRITTIERSSGAVDLIGYTWLRLARYHPSNGTVTVFTGHLPLRSDTVKNYIQEIVNRAEAAGKRIVKTGESPVYQEVPTPAASYIGEYILTHTDHSPVERNAMEAVRRSLIENWHSRPDPE